MARFRLLDLYSGCGGIALGAENAGFQTDLAIDNNSILTSSFAQNFPNVRLQLGDLGAVTKSALKVLLPDGIDGVVGGPPCQAFSAMGRRRKSDPRRELVGAFFRVVAETQPAFFVMENVPGLAFAENRPVLDAAIEKLGTRWKIVGPLELNAADFGAPTFRKRLFVFGFDPEKMNVPTAATLAFSDASKVTVRDAIADLIGARKSLDDDEGFDHWRYRPASAAISTYANSMRSKTNTFTGHRRTRHLNRVLKRFSRIAPGKSDKIGKYRRLQWGGFCPTLRAGTGSDLGSYQAVRPLHPERDRVITVREAARLQGFPDRFIFHPTIWHSFRMIGNSVSPILAEAIFRKILAHMELPASRLAAE